MTDERALVVGAGTMGHGIAHVLAAAGIRTTLVDQSLDIATRGRDSVVANLNKGVDKGKVTTEERDRTLALLDVSDATDALSETTIFLEAIPERMEWKKALFHTADEKLPPNALLGSNTSSLSITEIASATNRPSSVIGLHFFNPVHIMKLLEIVRGAHTSDATTARAKALAVRLGKTAVVVNDAPGFATSRLGITLGNEAMRMVEEGVASPKDIDTALKLGYGHPMGPLALSDLVGLDVRLNITEALFAELGTDGFRAPQILRRLVRAGHVGKKCGRGFYEWENGEIVGVNPIVHRTVDG